MNRHNSHLVDAVFAISLFCLFVVTGLVCVIVGADAYGGINDRMTENYDTRTSLVYLTEKIRSCDAGSDLEIASVDGSDALVLSQTVGESVYKTWFFVSDGSLREVTLSGDVAAKPGDGQAICEISSFVLERKDGGIIEITVTSAGGGCRTAAVGLRTAKGGASI